MPSLRSRIECQAGSRNRRELLQRLDGAAGDEEPSDANAVTAEDVNLSGGTETASPVPESVPLVAVLGSTNVTAVFTCSVKINYEQRVGKLGSRVKIERSNAVEAEHRFDKLTSSSSGDHGIATSPYPLFRRNPDRRTAADDPQRLLQPAKKQLALPSTAVARAKVVRVPKPSTGSRCFWHRFGILSTSDRSRRRVTPTAPVNPGLADTWGSDSLDDFSLVTQVGNLDDTNEDGQYLSAFADVDFSSPSSYPSFVNPPADDDPLARQAPSQPQQAAAAYPGSAAPLRRASACGRTMAAPSRSTTQLTASSVGESQNSLFNDILDEPLTSQSTQSSVADMPAPGTMHGLLNEEPEPGRFAKRRRMPGVASGNSTGVKDLVLPLVSDDDDLFGENENPPPDTDDFATIDLTKATEVPEELKKPEVDNRVKLSAFQCVICMDDVTTLTLTHCGHLFCQQCLHSSLHVDATRGKCPMCRAKIDMKPRASYNTKTKGFWPLELKLMTKSKQGKRKADDMA
ncbi:SLX8 protein [Purpureocillium lavendulum]|uniref:SLX8 protein n=1 Tax=Purpureocillium lavendulum TaxID=1247861 RepID=A0AB34G042_9HYPO|nr:SLX8 protein [Purpureocillium lavendulum]